MQVLVVVDMQQDFVTGVLGSKEAQAIVAQVVETIQRFPGEICVTYDTHQGDYLQTQEGKQLPIPHCLQGSPGWQLVPEVAQALAEKEEAQTVVKEFQKPVFGSVELCRYLMGKAEVEEITLIGVCTDICVLSNAIMLRSALPETKIRVLASCCAGISVEAHNRALEALGPCQIQVE